ncbi:hypothetical protein LCGC14_2342350 [marine sediment metagenome]|uniref:Uncharacterized protein n=1 Tax=marine sediment metagenome TaxID=412755 RepID=A0A0F9EPE4_9ZZZZ
MSRFFKVRLVDEDFEVEGLDPDATDEEQAEGILAVIKVTDLDFEEVFMEEEDKK